MRIRVAVCDDEANQLTYLRGLLEQWAGLRGKTVSVSLFESAGSFKDAFFDGAVFDILLLDIQMEGQSGVELAKELRGRNERLIIVFITGVADYIAEGYDVEALHYLIKPVGEAKFFQVMDSAANKLTAVERALLLPVDGELIKIATGDVLYAESFAHYTELHLARGAVLTVKISISDLSGQLGEGFVRYHRSYIVGLKHVSKILKTDVVLTGGLRVPLSRRLYQDVNRALIKWITG